jgi:hypothetical protein
VDSRSSGHRSGCRSFRDCAFSDSADAIHGYKEVLGFFEGDGRSTEAGTQILPHRKVWSDNISRVVPRFFAFEHYQ